MKKYILALSIPIYLYSYNLGCKYVTETDLKNANERFKSNYQELSYSYYGENLNRIQKSFSESEKQKMDQLKKEFKCVNLEKDLNNKYSNDFKNLESNSIIFKVLSFLKQENKLSYTKDILNDLRSYQIFQLEPIGIKNIFGFDINFKKNLYIAMFQLNNDTPEYKKQSFTASKSYKDNGIYFNDGLLPYQINNNIYSILVVQNGKEASITPLKLNLFDNEKILIFANEIARALGLEFRGNYPEEYKKYITSNEFKTKLEIEQNRTVNNSINFDPKYASKTQLIDFKVKREEIRQKLEKIPELIKEFAKLDQKYKLVKNQKKQLEALQKDSKTLENRKGKDIVLSNIYTNLDKVIKELEQEIKYSSNKLLHEIDQKELLKMSEAYAGEVISMLENEAYQNSIVRQQAIKYVNIGITFEQAKNYNEAISNCKKAMEIDNTYSLAYDCIANNYSKLHHYEEAINFYNKAINLDQYFMYYKHRASSYKNVSDYENAILDYNKAISINRYSADSYYQRGNIYLELNELEKALSDYQNAVKISSKYYEGNVKLLLLFLDKLQCISDELVNQDCYATYLSMQDLQKDKLKNILLIDKLEQVCPNWQNYQIDNCK